MQTSHFPFDVEGKVVGPQTKNTLFCMSVFSCDLRPEELSDSDDVGA